MQTCSKSVHQQDPQLAVWEMLTSLAEGSGTGWEARLPAYNGSQGNHGHCAQGLVILAGCCPSWDRVDYESFSHPLPTTMPRNP
jgi:hypothetical protein